MNKPPLISSASGTARSVLLLISALAGLCLFFTPTAVSVLITGGVLVIICLYLFVEPLSPVTVSDSLGRCIAAFMALVAEVMGFLTFFLTWRPSGMVGRLASLIHVSPSVLVLILGFVGCAAAWYGLYRLFCRCVAYIRELCPGQQKGSGWKNLRRGWYLPASALCFFSLTVTNSFEYWLGIFLVAASMAVVAGRIPSLFRLVRQESVPLQAVSLASALGICLGNRPQFLSVAAERGISAGPLPEAASWLLCFGGVFFAAMAVGLFWKALLPILNSIRRKLALTGTERLLYVGLLLLTIFVTGWIFFRTDAFYGTDHPFDIIYTSDSPTLVSKNVYLTLTLSENDLRQPLFAVFSAPFTAIPSLISLLLGSHPALNALLVNISQLLLLFAAHLILMALLELKPKERICFLLLTCCGYPHLLFCLMMEQYITAYFWLILCLYLLIHRKEPPRLALWGAGGTLLTSAVLLPFLSRRCPIKDFRRWLMDTVKYGLEFVAVILIFCRFDVMLNLANNLSFLGEFTGKALTFADKLLQYTVFIRSCFLSPAAQICDNGFPSWQLPMPGDADVLGLVILAACGLTALSDRRNKITLTLFLWGCFSAVVLLLLGWGTQENGLILYALYFSWAFQSLVFTLLKKLAGMLRLPWLLPSAAIVLAMAMLLWNLPAMVRLIQFAVTNYPL